jgi:hypothetical protein
LLALLGGVHELFVDVRRLLVRVLECRSSAKVRAILQVDEETRRTLCGKLVQQRTVHCGAWCGFCRGSGGLARDPGDQSDGNRNERSPPSMY